MRGHADAETLAAFREGLLSRRKAGQVSAHLAGCPRCAALDAQLAEVTALLTRSTAQPMPDALTARIEAALAAEAATRSAAAPAAVRADGAGTAVPGAPGRGGAGGGAQGAAGRGTARPGPGRFRLALRVAAVTAAVAVIAGGGYGVARLLSPGTTTETSAGSRAEGAPAARSPVTLPRNSPAGGVGAPGGAAHAPASVAAARVVSSGTNYQPGRLGAQAAAVLARLGPNAHTSPRPAPNHAALQPAVGFPELQACVTHVAGGQRPLLVDMARYRGRPAAVIVLRARSGGRPRALVVAPGCTRTSAQIVATATLPGPG